MKTNTSKEKSFYTQGKQCAARVLLIAGLLVSYSPRNVLAAPDPVPQQAMMLEANSVTNTPSIHISQKVVPDQGGELLSTFPEASPVEENLPFQARGGEGVRFHYQNGQWYAQVSSRIGSFSRRAMLPVVCRQGADVASSLEVLSKYPSWQHQRQIHVLGEYVCPTLGEVVYVGELGLRGGGEGEASGSGSSTAEQPQQAANPPAATDPASQWKVVTHEGKLALQKVDGCALWVPKGEGSASWWDPFLTPYAPKLRELSRREAFLRMHAARSAISLSPLLSLLELVIATPWLLSTPRPRDCCICSQYVSVADDAEDNALDVDLNLDSGEAAWLYPFDSPSDSGNSGKLWVAYLPKRDIIAWVRAESPRCLFVSDFQTDPCRYHSCKACREPCIIVTTPEHEVRRARAQREQQRQAKKHEEQIRKAQAEQEEQSRLNERISQAAANFPTSARQFVSQPSVVERHEACLQKIPKRQEEQANDTVYSETIVTSGVTSGTAPDGADSQAHRSAEKNQDASTSY